MESRWRDSEPKEDQKPVVTWNARLHLFIYFLMYSLDWHKTSICEEPIKGISAKGTKASGCRILFSLLDCSSFWSFHIGVGGRTSCFFVHNWSWLVYKKKKMIIENAVDWKLVRWISKMLELTSQSILLTCKVEPIVLCFSAYVYYTYSIYVYIYSYIYTYMYTHVCWK